MNKRLIPSDFGFSINTSTARLERKDVYLPDIDATVICIIEPVLMPEGTHLTIALTSRFLEADLPETERAMRFQFTTPDALLMATANPAFMASALWELATQKLPGELAEALIEDPACDIPTAFDRLAERTDPDTPFDFTRYQIAQVVFATVGATPETI